VGADRQTSWVFVEDLADGMVRVMERAEPGRDYLMTGDTATVQEVAEQVCEISGTALPKRSLSPSRARLLTRIASPFYRLRGRKPPIDVEQLRSLDCHWCFDDQRARSELDWTPRTLAQGLPPSVEYFLSV
jgi:nucleoside-diphosphate-sugar epimerase